METFLPGVLTTDNIGKFIEENMGAKQEYDIEEVDDDMVIEEEEEDFDYHDDSKPFNFEDGNYLYSILKREVVKLA